MTEYVAAVTVAIPFARDGSELKRAWHVFLDNGSDGNLIFIKKLMSKAPVQTRGHNPYVVWGTSNGTFKTTKVRMCR